MMPAGRRGTALDRGTQRFWCEWTTAAGKSYVLVEPVAGTTRRVFDNDRIAGIGQTVMSHVRA
ncbi:MAG TPA: hypothetical protein VGA37_15135 [Gemmatimonadales bacterium]